MTILRAGTATDVGRVRSNNQDSHLVLDAISLYGVADGMGGHQGGEVASAIAVELTGKHATEPTLDSLMAAVRIANRAIFEKAGSDRDLHGMGTTLVAIQLVLPLPRDARAKRVCQALLDHPADDRSLAAWGKLVGASSRTLARLFWRETGMTFGKWVQTMRLSLALDRLALGESVTRVALELGYATPSAFSAMFRRRLGASPSHYLS